MLLRSTPWSRAVKRVEVSSEKDLWPCGVVKWMCAALEMPASSSEVGGSEELVRTGLEFEVIANRRLSNGSFCADSAKAMVGDVEIGGSREEVGAAKAQ